MPRSIDPPEQAAAIAERYHRLQRRLSVALVLLVVTTAVVAFFTLPRWIDLLAVIALVGAIRMPVMRVDGTARLASDAAPESVAADFGGPTPPPLAFQWGLADHIEPLADGARYDFSYLFGRRSVSMALEVRSADADHGRAMELFLEAADRPWATYDVRIRGQGDETVVDLAWQSEHRFGLRRLPEWIAARRFRERALGAQGYDVLERDASVGV